MSTARLQRITELAHKEKQSGLTVEEKEEQQRLRKEYLAAFRKNVIAQLDNTYIVDEDGNEHKLKMKED